MRTLHLAGHWPFNLYDVARFGCFDYFAAEPMPLADNFDAGQGPGLFMRKAGAAGVPQAVAGSEARRIYALSSFTRADGEKQLVGLGVRTADLFAADLPLPQRWALVTPHDLMVFVSLDGSTWSETSLGALEKGGGDYPLEKYFGEIGVDPLEEDALFQRDDSIQNAFMNSPNGWVAAPALDGSPSLWCCTGRYLLEWDGWDARVTPLAGRCGTVVSDGGKFYLSAGSRSQVALADGQIVLMPAATGTVAPTAYRAVPHASDGRINIVAPTGAAALAVNGALLAVCGYVGGEWAAVFTRPFSKVDTTQYAGAVTLPSLPPGTLTLATDDVEWLELAGQEQFLDLGRVSPDPILGIFPPDVFAIRRASSRAYINQRKDLQDQAGGGQLADMNRATSPVLEVLSNPNLADFDLTAGRVDGTGYVLGTADGWVLGARLDTNTIKPLGRLDSAVLRLLRRGGHYYALTSSALWRSPTGSEWQTMHEAAAGEILADCLLDGDTLLVVVARAEDSTVAAYDVSIGVPVAGNLQTLEFPATRAARFGGQVYVFGNSTAGSYAVGNSDAFSAHTDAVLAGQAVTAAIGGSAALWAGTASGHLLQFAGGAWALVANAAHPIGALDLAGDSVLIGLTDGTGTFRVWDGTSLATEPLSVTCARDANLFLHSTTWDGTDGGGGSDVDDGEGDSDTTGDGEGGGDLCGVVILTDAGPVWPTCAAGDVLWFSSVRTYGEIGDIFDAVTCAPLHSSGSIQRARCFVGPSDADDDLRKYQPLQPGLRTQVLRPDRSYRFAVAAPPGELYPDFEFQVFCREWSD